MFLVLWSRHIGEKDFKTWNIKHKPFVWSIQLWSLFNKIFFGSALLILHSWKNLWNPGNIPEEFEHTENENYFDYNFIIYLFRVPLGLKRRKLINFYNLLICKKSTEIFSTNWIENSEIPNVKIYCINRKYWDQENQKILIEQFKCQRSTLPN